MMNPDIKDQFERLMKAVEKDGYIKHSTYCQEIDDARERGIRVSIERQSNQWANREFWVGAIFGGTFMLGLVGFINWLHGHG